MFNNGLKVLFENEKVEIYTKVTTIKDNGSTSEKWIKKQTILCNVQADYRNGEHINKSESGDRKTSNYNLYTREPIFLGYRVKRIQEDNLFYEIVDVEHNGKKTILEHYKARLERIDNQ